MMTKIVAAQIVQDAAWNAAVSAVPGVGALRVVSVAYAATITPNADTTDCLNVGSMTGNLTLNVPTGSPVDWQPMLINLPAISADRTVTLNASFDIPTGTVVTSPFTVSAGTSTVVALRYRTAASKWRIAAIQTGYS